MKHTSFKNTDCTQDLYSHIYFLCMRKITKEYAFYAFFFFNHRDQFLNSDLFQACNTEWDWICIAHRDIQKPKFLSRDMDTFIIFNLSLLSRSLCRLRSIYPLLPIAYPYFTLLHSFQLLQDACCKSLLSCSLHRGCLCEGLASIQTGMF